MEEILSHSLVQLSCIQSILSDTSGCICDEVWAVGINQPDTQNSIKSSCLEDFPAGFIRLSSMCFLLITDMLSGKFGNLKDRGRGIRSQHQSHNNAQPELDHANSLICVCEGLADGSIMTQGHAEI